MAKDDPPSHNRIWLRQSSNGKISGPFSSEIVQRWYDNNAILSSAQLSSDGRSWKGIDSLRHRNGPAFPFCSLENNQQSGMNSVEIARKKVFNAKSEVDRLESEMESILKQLEEDERMLKRLKKMAKVLGTNSPHDMNDDEFEVETRSEGESNNAYGREEIIRMAGASQATFTPFFFCPRAFYECAAAKNSPLHSVRRIGPPPKVRDPVPLIGPLAILARCDNLANRVDGDPTAALKKLAKFHNRSYRWQPFFRATYSVYQLLRCDFDAFHHPSPVVCQLCNESINSAIGLITHVISNRHSDKLTGLRTSVDCQALAFWSDAIDRCISNREDATSSRSAETVEPLEETEIESARSLVRLEVMRIGHAMRSIMSSKMANTRDIFRPRFFCPRAFLSVACADSTALHEMKRVCPAAVTKLSWIYRAPIPLDGPLLILARCDDRQNQLEHTLRQNGFDCRSALLQLSPVGRCNLAKLAHFTFNLYYTKMRPNFDEFFHPAPIVCELCDFGIRSPLSLLKHVSSYFHINQVEQQGTSVDKRAYFYWREVIDKTNR